MLKRLLLGGGLAGCAFAGGLVAGLASRAGSLAAAPADALPPPPAAFEPDAAASSLSARFETVVRKLSPTVVAVDAIKPPAPSTSTSNKGKSVEESGSGVMVKFAGRPGTVVVTNNHVVGGAAPDKVTVTLSDGRIIRPVQIWSDPESDIALLRLESESLPVAEFGDSDRCRRGMWVLAFGSPFGLNQTVTHGIISATDRGQISLGSTIRIKEFLQTDAAINPGSSGGPLADLDGKVVGINTAIASQNGTNSGVAFSIPANLVKRIARQLFEKGTVSRGYLGVQLASSLDPNEALRLGLDRVTGAIIEVVHPDTPAQLAGLQVRDVILTIEGVNVRDENHLINVISNLPPGQRVKLGIWRERRTQAAEVTIGDWSVARTK